jgi:chemotaxis protein MotB
MTSSLKRGFSLLPLMAPVLLTACVSQSSYDDLQAKYQSLQQQSAAQAAQISRLQGAIRYTVNSDLLFTPGGWDIRASGKQVIANLAKKLAPTQQNKILVSGYTDNAPIGPALAARGVTTNQILSQKRADSVMQFLISQGLSPDLVSAQGFGEANPVASNDTAQGRAKNRRVDLSIAP